jgi:hypothetical protein
LHQFEEGMYVLFQEPQSAITAGQFAAWYIEDELVGSELFQISALYKMIKLSLMFKLCFMNILLTKIKTLDFIKCLIMKSKLFILMFTAHHCRHRKMLGCILLLK